MIPYYATMQHLHACAITLTTPIYIDCAVNFDINESIANILNAMCKVYYDEGVYSLRQVCMYRPVDKGGAPAPKAPPLAMLLTLTYTEIEHAQHD